ncbi:hypothetical protein [Desulfosarcina sp.]|uniref:hypothetical protein n=1 Tax=Desulfosarcina sp. TaxID=2027861 RepID=UPI003562A52C
MDIVLINSAFVRNEEPKKRPTRVPGKKLNFTEKRRNRTDRRKSVRDGVVVSLSYQNDRRTGSDRRRTDT